ncbi:MAG TPA: hypothetical protein VL361_11115 [Candidatus Limnocylindrales bacterium]|nr:hypothetical protein [Candidatus Limnocylindrales bacterium]
MSSKDKRELSHEDLEKIAGGNADTAPRTSSSTSGGYKPPHVPPVVHHHTSTSISTSGSGRSRS